MVEWSYALPTTPIETAERMIRAAIVRQTIKAAIVHLVCVMVGVFRR